MLGDFNDEPLRRKPFHMPKRYSVRIDRNQGAEVSASARQVWRRFVFAHEAIILQPELAAASGAGR
jgi:hypothetical protein